MKIYCSRREKTLEDFIGKNLWVRACYRSRNGSEDLIGYVKILFNTDKTILCCYVADDLINADDSYTWLKKAEFKRPYKSSLNLLTVLDFTDIMTDEEMKEILGI